MKILLTGVSSFTGKQLLPLLNAAGHDVFCLVRKKCGFDNEFLWDFTSPLPNVLPSCEVVINLAAYVDFDVKMNVDQYRINTVSVMELVAYAQKENAFFIQTSMAGMHGTTGVISKDTTISPGNSYGMSKYLTDEMIVRFLKRYAILRIGGIYGYDGPPHLGLNNAMRQALDHRCPPTLKGSGKAKRNYICVLDVAKWIEHLVREAELSSKDIKHIIYMASSEIMTIEAYLEEIIDILLPGNQINRMEGGDGTDFVVKPSPFPFELTHFSTYLHTIKNVRD